LEGEKWCAGLLYTEEWAIIQGWLSLGVRGGGWKIEFNEFMGANYSIRLIKIPEAQNFLAGSSWRRQISTL